MATEQRLIDATDWDSFYADMGDSRNVMDSYYMGYTDALDRVDDWMDAQPTIEARPVVHGRWIKDWCDSSFIGHEYERCSICDCHMLDTNQFWDCDFCPVCGAKMDGDSNG